MPQKYTKLEWCCIQKNGIKLITPNPVLGQSYLDTAENDLPGLESGTFRIQNESAFNACYNSFYAILQKIGIKCELHDCTFEFFNLIKGFSEEQTELMNTLNKNLLEIEQETKKARPVNPLPVEEFFRTAKQVFTSLSQNDIRLIRQEVEFAKKHKRV